MTGPSAPDPAVETALAWHDVTCPEGPECRSRRLHAAAEPIPNSGVLERFLERLAALRSAAGTDVDDLAEDALIRLGFVVAQSAARMDERTRAAIEADLITVRAALRAGGGS